MDIPLVCKVPVCHSQYDIAGLIDAAYRLSILSTCNEEESRNKDSLLYRNIGEINSSFLLSKMWYDHRLYIEV